MGSEWPLIKLENCMDAIIDYRGKTPKKTISGIPLITAKIIKSGTILPVGEYISEDDYDSWMKRGMPKSGDILLTTEAPLGEIAQLDDRKIALAQRVITLRGKKGFLDNKFLKYLMLSDFVQQQLIARATGTTVLGIKQSELRKIELPIPDISEQCSIAHILGTLDDKIELNRKMNKTLEAMAQALFKSWFVDFDPVIDNALAAGKPIPEEFKARAEIRKSLGDARKPLPEDVRALFPNEFVKTEEMGWVPKGWEVKNMLEMVNLIGGGTPKTNKPEYWNGTIPWFSVVDAPNDSDVFVINTEKKISQLGLDNSSAKMLTVGTTIISARGTVGKCAMVCIPTTMNQSCYGVRGKNKISDSFVYYLIRNNIGNLSKSGHGSVFNTITRSTFQTIKIPCSPVIITQNFEKLLKPILEKIHQNLFHRESLKSTRDTLLPKLISGEINLQNRV